MRRAQRGLAVDGEDLVTLVQVGAVASDARLVEDLDHGEDDGLLAGGARRVVARHVAERGEAVADGLRSKGLQAQAIQLDITQGASCTELAAGMPCYDEAVYVW